MRRKKLTPSSSQVEVWNAQGVASGPSYEAFTMSTPRGLSTIGTPVDTSLTGRKRPASDSEQSHDSPVQQANVQNGGLQSSVGSSIPAQQATSAGVKQIVLRLSSLKQSSPALGELSSLKCGEPVTNKGTEVESQQWSNGTECIEKRQAENSNRPDVQSSSQGAPARVLQMPEGIVAQKENQCCGNDSGGCCVLDSVNGQPTSGFGQPTNHPHPTNPSWIFNANVCGSSCCVPPSMNNQPVNPCSACAATRFTTFQPGVPRAVHYISGEDVMVCPAPWVHEGREEIYHIPDYVYPSGHCNGFANDLDMETQRHLEEQIAQEILLLSQKLANLQARYGARRLPAPNDTKPVVLSCPLTPLFLDTTRRDVKSYPRAPSASRSSQRLNHPEPRCQLEERKLGVGRSGGTNIKPASSTSAQPPNRGNETTTSIKSHPYSRPGNNTTGFRAESGCQPVVANDLSQGCELGKANKNSPSPSRKRRDRQTEEHVDENSFSDDMKDLMKPEANVGGYPDLGKRFDWVKTLRIAGVREPQGCSDDAPISVSKSVQTGGALDSLIDNDARASEVLEESRLKRRPDGRRNGKRTLCSPDEMGSLDSRVNKHLLKAGLRRAPSHWKPGPARNALRVKKKIFGSRSPRKDGGKRLRTRTLLDVNFTPYSAKVVPHEEKLGLSKERECEDDVQWQGEVADCEAEFETFVGEDIASNVSRDEGESQKRSSNASATSPAKLFLAPVLSLLKSSHAPKKTFIRCIDLMVASKKKNQLSKLNGHSKISSGGRCSHRRLDSLLMDGCELANDCQPDPPSNEGAVLQSTEAADKQSFPKRNEESSTVTTMETQDSNCSIRECCSAVTPVSNLASVLSRVIPKQMEHMDAAQLRARWEELIDALEKERLGLPKIKTSSRKMGPNSPRDSGGVKRIAEQMKNLRPPNPPKEDEDVSLTRGRPLWSKVEQKQEVVF